MRHTAKRNNFSSLITAIQEIQFFWLKAYKPLLLNINSLSLLFCMIYFGWIVCPLSMCLNEKITDISHYSLTSGQCAGADLKLCQSFL